jgi:hypothetical protein
MAEGRLLQSGRLLPVLPASVARGNGHGNGAGNGHGHSHDHGTAGGAAAHHK